MPDEKKHELNIVDDLYLPAIGKGMGVTLKHLFQEKFTIEYPEVRRRVHPGYRGLHRLNRDDKGRVKCVACFLCQTICPARCIMIVGAASPWPDREKYPESFKIDELRCIYCGYCEEACPEEAIELTDIYDFGGGTREEMIYDKEKLLAVYDLTIARERAEAQTQEKNEG